jgi:membrane-associated phospholipid phosphatase
VAHPSDRIPSAVRLPQGEPDRDTSSRLIEPDHATFAPRLIGTPRRRVITGCVLLAIAAIGGVYFAFVPAPTPLDRLAESILPNEWNSRPLVWIVARALPPTLVLGAALSCVVALFWDRMRAVTCLVAPALAVAITDYLMKPLVGRIIDEGGVVGISYPSGHMTGTVAVVAVAVLAVPSRWRKSALVVGCCVDFAVGISLIVIRWHFATDVLGGAAVALGTTLLIDTALHLLLGSNSSRRRQVSSEPIL